MVGRHLSSACKQVNMHHCQPSNVGPAVFQMTMQANPHLFFFAQHIKVEHQHQQWYNSSLTSQAALYCPSATSSHGIFGQIPLSLDYCCEVRAHRHNCPNLHMHHLACFIHAFRNHSLIISSDHLPGRHASGFSHYPWLPWPTYVCV